MRQIDYWITSGVLRTSVPTVRKRWRRFTLTDVLLARTIMELREQGVGLQHIRKAVRKLLDQVKDQPSPALALSRYKLVGYKGEVFAYTRGRWAQRAVDGQMTYLFVDLEPIYESVVSAIPERGETFGTISEGALPLPNTVKA